MSDFGRRVESSSGSQGGGGNAYAIRVGGENGWRREEGTRHYLIAIAPAEK